MPANPPTPEPRATSQARELFAIELEREDFQLLAEEMREYGIDTLPGKLRAGLRAIEAALAFPKPALAEGEMVDDDAAISHFAMLYREYGLSPDAKLAPDALELKRKVLAALPAPLEGDWVAEGIWTRPEYAAADRARNAALAIDPNDQMGALAAAVDAALASAPPAPAEDGCPFCGSPGKLIHPMGDWQGDDGGKRSAYAPDGSRIVCRSDACSGCTPAFYGPDQDAQAWAFWKKRPALTPAPAAEDGWRPEVVAFANLMERQLRANDHKPGWKDDLPSDLHARLREEAVELEEATDLHAERIGWGDQWMMEDTLIRVGEEAAHVANFAMMIADVCGALTPTTEEAAEGEGRSNA